ncbi:uncharacterized protein LOC123967965 [Micropterus dolomieu]|uniref:uncharacterized protein LOC123967965 n=1 Tax=Micropterus dolomieu TaxID=147949 RepID=UPI001E8D692D|nr:uncharacterized protein LOC123967965 [Micropterus dolomieu]
MQNGFILLLIIWNSSTFASGNDANHLQFPLGCQAVIPCQHSKSDSDSFQWFYKKDEHSRKVQLFFQDKTGVERHQKFSRSRMRVLRNRSLVIDPLTEDDQGLYWCENCFQDKTIVKNCQSKQPTVFSVKKEILKETYKTCYVTAGSSFTHACPGEPTNLKWTFEASHMAALNNSVQGPELYIVTSNKSIYIVNVKRANAGKYTCWTSGCDGHRQKLLIINLCVIIVHNSEDSSVSCAVICDLEFSNIAANSTSNVETGTMTKSVFVDPYGSLNCSAKQMFEGYSTVQYSTHGPSNALNKTTGGCFAVSLEYMS